jgi:polar amino acid transport system substrate-binding protein
MSTEQSADRTFRKAIFSGREAMLRACKIALALTMLMVGTAAAQTKDQRVADLVEAGKVRVGLFDPQFIKDPKTGELRGVWAEVAKALATRIGVQLVLLEHATPPLAVECLKAGSCDLLFLPFDARAANAGDFSPPIFQFEYTLLVPAVSSIRNVADADRPGTRIAAVRNHASTMTLIPLLKQAELIYADTPDPTFELLRSGRAGAFASTRPVLLKYSAQLSGSRVLESHYGANINRMVVPKGNAGRLAYVSEFVEDAKASGLVQKAIERAGPRGITVAPAGDPK